MAFHNTALMGDTASFNYAMMPPPAMVPSLMANKTEQYQAPWGGHNNGSFHSLGSGGHGSGGYNESSFLPPDSGSYNDGSFQPSGTVGYSDSSFQPSHHESSYQALNMGGYNESSFQAPSRGGYNQSSFQAPSRGGYNERSFQAPSRGGYNESSFQAPSRGGYNESSFKAPSRGGYNESSFQAPSRGGYNESSFQAPSRGGYNESSFQAPSRGGYNESSFQAPSRGGYNESSFQPRGRGTTGSFRGSRGGPAPKSMSFGEFYNGGSQEVGYGDWTTESSYTEPPKQSGDYGGSEAYGYESQFGSGSRAGKQPRGGRGRGYGGEAAYSGGGGFGGTEGYSEGYSEGDGYGGGQAEGFGGDGGYGGSGTDQSYFGSDIYGTGDVYGGGNEYMEDSDYGWSFGGGGPSGFATGGVGRGGRGAARGGRGAAMGAYPGGIDSAGDGGRGITRGKVFGNTGRGFGSGRGGPEGGLRGGPIGARGGGAAVFSARGAFGRGRGRGGPNDTRKDSGGDGGLSQQGFGGSQSARGGFGSGGGFQRGGSNSVRSRGGARTSIPSRGGVVRGRGQGKQGDRGGSRGSGKGVGPGATRTNLPKSAPVTTSDTGVGLISIFDLVKSAKHRLAKATKEKAKPPAPMQSMVSSWKTFAEGFADCGNPISNMECSLNASKVHALGLSFDCKFLVKCNIYSVFTGELILKKFVNGSAVDSCFLSRGIGLSKKSAKLDCYEKAYQLLLNASVDEFLSQVDCGEKMLKDEFNAQHLKDPGGVLELLKRGDTTSTSGQKRRIERVAYGVSEAKRWKSSEARGPGIDVTSLAPRKQMGVLMKRDDPLKDKLAKLKELLKEEGITKLHIVPKIDQFAQKTALNIKNVYRFRDVPVPGYEDRVPVFVEIYFDNKFMAAGHPDFKGEVAMRQAYVRLTNILCTKPLEALTSCTRYWHPHMEFEPDVYTVSTKWQGQDNNCLLTSNLANMKQMMQSNPNLSIPHNKMVITEHEADENIENIFKSLELSATRNLMLLECEIARTSDMNFRCTISLQGKHLCTKTHGTKTGAKRLCSVAIMTDLKKNNDNIYVGNFHIGRVITKEELVKTAKQMKANGTPPFNYEPRFSPLEKQLIPKTASAEQRQRLEIERKQQEEFENLPENVALRPLLPWIAQAFCDIIDNYYRKVTLEDLLINVHDFSRLQRDVITQVAMKCRLRVITRMKRSGETVQPQSLLRRTITAQDMSKILQLNNGKSGRFTLRKCVQPLSEEELEEFRQECLKKHDAMVAARSSPEVSPPVDAISDTALALGGTK